MEWTGWRGPNRDGRVAWLPERLPNKATPIWTIDVLAPGLGGVAATQELVLFSDRGLDDTADVWKCVSTKDGKEIWSHTYLAKGKLDYGNSPRATPLIVGDLVYLLGAFGHLSCVKLKTGEVVWEMSLRDEFEPEDDPKWGACSSPLIVDGKLIVNPGAKDASLAALDPKTGKILWKSPGRAAGYGSLMVGTFGGKLQLVGHDATSLNGWDPTTGKHLWRVSPDRPNDFNVPTPIAIDGKLLVTTENNGTRLYAFENGGIINPKPVATQRRLAPDTHTPVVVGDRIFGVWRRLFCLNAKDRLEVTWESDDKAFARYAAIVATEQHALVMTLDAEFVLFDVTAAEFKPLGQLKMLPNEKGLYSHPAFVGKRVYVRGGSTLACFDWE